jgi:hypothetical protein
MPALAPVITTTLSWIMRANLSPPRRAGPPRTAQRAAKGRDTTARVADAIEAHYRARRDELAGSLAALTRRSDGLSRARLLTFLAAAALGGLALARGLPWLAEALAGAFGLAFVALVVRHAFVASDRTRVEQRVALVDEALGRLAGRIPASADGGERFAVPGHPYADDLDVLGPRSLFRLVSRAETDVGQETLARWLLAPAAADEVRARQEAVRELADKPAFLEELAMRGRLAGARGREADPLVAWAEGAPVLPTGGAKAEGSLVVRGALVRAAKVLVPLTVASGIATAIAGPEGLLAHAWLAPVVLQAAVLAALLVPVGRVVSEVSSRESPFGRYRAIFELVEGETFACGRLVALGARLADGEKRRASGAIAALERVIGFADLRHNTVIHFVANVGLLWDVFCAEALERWRARSGARVRGWLAALGELEALASLATLARERPSWAIPDVEPGPTRLEAEGLGHPLIDEARRVINDVRLAAEPGAAPFPGQALLVTGSNMSGKSTWLRSIGLCAVMALAGGPVCARSARLSPLRPWTSMRIRDAVDEGVSHFYAEVRRLKAVVDASAAGPDVLFLLDEILHGTNSRERIVGASHVVADLVRRGAIGAVSSHDLGLAGLEQASEGRVHNVHFRELVEDGAMTFDYRLREGVVDTSNALRVMRMAGLDVPEG